MSNPTAPPLELVAPSSKQALLGTSSLPHSVHSHDHQVVGDDVDVLRVQNGLLAMGANFGLARLVAQNDRQVAIRIFLLDNSGSTCSYDGKYLDTEGQGGRMEMVQCTRWEEIRRMAKQQAAINAQIGTMCEFVLLNPPTRRSFAAFCEGVDLAVVDPRRGEIAPQLDALERMLRNTRPEGATPLAERLEEIHHHLATHHAGLAERGFRAVVIVATDGLPTSLGSNLPSDAARQEVTTSLRRLTSTLPVFVVIRLTTDEDAVVAYYNQLDEEEELALEVIDDIEGEAREAAGHGNGWLVYSPLLHMLREGGTFVRFFDALDERRLNPAEVRALASELLQRSEGDEPLPREGVNFYCEARARVQALPSVYDPLTRQPAPVMRLRALRQASGVGLVAMLCSRCRRR